MTNEEMAEISELPFYSQGTFYAGFLLEQNSYCKNKCKDKSCLRKFDQFDSSRSNSFQWERCHKNYDLLFYQDLSLNQFMINGIIRWDNTEINRDIRKSRPNYIVSEIQIKRYEKIINKFEEISETGIKEATDLGKNYAVLHDVKTAFGLITSYVDELVNSKKGNTFTDKLKGSGQIIRDLYDAVELTNSQLQMIDIFVNPNSIRYGRKTPTNIYRLFERVSKLLRKRANQKGVKINWNSNKQIERAYYYDAIQFVPIILLDNGIKYSLDNKNIYIDYSLSNDEKQIEIKVKSYGPQVDVNERSHIFLKLYRGKNAKKRNIGGIGVGLYILNEILKAHGGEVSYECGNDSDGEFNVFKCTIEFEKYMI